jgi:D-alanyl-D-alanine carboxypeptidase (penicillin-binding protein 5/6)
MYGLLLPSGNDAATALALHCSNFFNGFGIRPFVDEMNVQAKRLGMRETSYNNPHGLGDIQNKSTARDI